MDCSALSKDILSEEVGPDDGDVLRVKSQVPFFAYAQESLVAINGNHSDGRFMVQSHLRDDGPDTGLGVPILFGKDFIGFIFPSSINSARN